MSVPAVKISLSSFSHLRRLIATEWTISLLTDAQLHMQHVWGGEGNTPRAGHQGKIRRCFHRAIYDSSTRCPRTTVSRKWDKWAGATTEGGGRALGVNVGKLNRRAKWRRINWMDKTLMRVGEERGLYCVCGNRQSEVVVKPKGQNKECISDVLIFISGSK